MSKKDKMAANGSPKRRCELYSPLKGGGPSFLAMNFLFIESQHKCVFVYSLY